MKKWVERRLFKLSERRLSVTAGRLPLVRYVDIAVARYGRLTRVSASRNIELFCLFLFCTAL